MHRTLSAALLGLAACNLALDFDDLEGLPCPCSPGFVCIESSDRCLPTGSSEPFKACLQDTPNGGDELCPADHRCVAINAQGPRCLPQCQPVIYARPSAGARIAEQCSAGTTCWESPKGGVCSEGVCRDNPNDCSQPGERCAIFNGAGVCFLECDPLLTSPLPCGGDQLCHPIGTTDITACVAGGNLASGALCTRAEDGMCEKTDGLGRALICASFEATTNEQLFCRPVCDPATLAGCVAPETCSLVRSRLDPTTGRSLGACRP